MPLDNLQFNNLAIYSEVHVPSGTTIRCKGTFTNLGKIIVDQIRSTDDAGDPNYPISSETYGGIAKKPARFNSEDYSMTGGLAHTGETLKTLATIGVIGGGSGVLLKPSGSGFTYLVENRGGGALRIFAKGQLIAGNIQAAGEDGQSAAHLFVGTGQNGDIYNILPASGAGGGGVVILASATSISVSGMIDVHGGTGGPGQTFTFNTIVGVRTEIDNPGGGGGGGVIRCMAPAVTGSGFNVKAGSNGIGTLSTDGSAAGAGGACAGDGGVSSVDGNGVLHTTLPTDGQVFIDQHDPAALLLH